MPRIRKAQGITKASLREAERAERKAAKTARDSFQNWNINLGLGTQNAMSGGTYGFNPISRVRTLIEFMYRGNWLSEVLIDQVAQDMTRGGVDIQSDADPTDIQKIENKATRLRVWHSLCDVIKWARLYGGCLGYIQIDGADPATPLRMEAIPRDSFKGIMVLDRWMLEPQFTPLIEDGADAGLPQFYRVTSDAPGLKGRTVHHSRCVRAVGVDLPYWQRMMENMWGISIFEPLYDRMVAFDSATMGAAQLAYKAHLRWMKIKGYRQILAAGGQLAVGLAKQMEAMRFGQSIEGMTAIDAEDELGMHQTSAFSGLSDIMLQLGQQISGGAQIPLTKLFGQSPAGLNSTGESDIRNYYDGIKQKQNHTLKEGVHKIYRVISASERIDLGEEFDIEFRPLWQLTDDEMSSIEERGTRSVLAVEEAGLISPKTALMELKSRGHNTNTWQTITEEDLEAASDEPVPQAEPIDPDEALKKEVGGKDHVANIRKVA